MSTTSSLRIVFIARHGETDWNRDGRWQGHTDIELNAAGRAQAEAMAERVKSAGIRRVHASDLSRARETGQIVAARIGAAFMGADGRLRERSFGVFEGLTRGECEARYPDEWTRYRHDPRNKPPGAEAHDDVIARMLEGVRAIAAAEPGVALVVSHGGAIRALVAAVTRRPCGPIGNAAVYRLTLEAAPEGFRFLGADEI